MYRESIRRLNLYAQTRLLRRVTACGRIPRRFALTAALLVTACCLQALAQTPPNIQYTKNGTDSKLRGELRVNPSTLALEFQLPVAAYPGRAGVSVPVTISYSSSVWRIAYQFYNPGQYTSSGQPIGNGYTGVAAVYAERSRAGWVSSLEYPVVDTWSNGEAYDQFGSPTGNTCPLGCYFIDKVLVRLPDGSAHELRSSDQPVTINTALPDDLYAVDGSRLRYQRSTQTLFMPDGSRYRYVNNVPQYVDRNGNTVTFGNGVTDTMGRAITPPPLSGTAGDYTYTPPGTTGTYTFKWRTLGTAGVLTTSQPLAYYADGSCPGVGGTNSPRLFTSGGAAGTCYANGGSTFNPVVLYQIVLPTNQAYTFTYNVYGEVDKVQLPTGGYERYVYGAVGGVSSGQQPYTQSSRGVTNRFVSAGGAGTDEVLWQYSSSGQLVSTTPPDNTLIERQQYQDAPIGGSFGYSSNGARAGQAFEERYYSAPDNVNVRHLLRRVLTDWAVTGSNATSQFPAAQQYANRNPRVLKQVEILLDTGGAALAKTTAYGYDTTYQFSAGVGRTSVSEYDYVSVDRNTAETGTINSIPTAAQPLRITETEYLDHNTSYRDRNVLGQPTSVTIKNGAGTIVAQTTISYDESAYQLGNTYGSVTQWADPAAARGNATTMSRWLDTGNVWIETHAQYDQCGSVAATWDANGNRTQVDYSSAYAFAYPTRVTTPAPNPGVVNGSPPGTFGSTTGLTAFTSYDFSTGLVTSTTDVNSKTTTYDYTDPLDRLKRVDHPDGGRTAFTYVDSHQCGAYVETRTLLDSSGRETDSYQFHDGLGRPYLAETFDGQDAANPWLRVDTRYDPAGRVSQVSNPYRSAGCGAAANPSGRWATTAYDALGRAKSVTTADGAAVSTDYVGSQVTVTDQAGRKRRSVTDALGRLVRVDEPDASTGSLDGAGGNPVQSTFYTYDALGNLRRVDQGGQVRFFMYDSLSRLVRAKNPEQAAGSSASNVTDPATGNSQWSTAYGYDDNGNLKTRTDARDVTAYYTYDGLNRNVLTSYTDGTPSVGRVYDKTANGVGRLSWDPSWDATGAGVALSSYSYDAVGRVQFRNQYFWAGNDWSTNYSTSYVYDLAGNVTSVGYPSGRTVSYAYDRAGRVVNFAGSLGDGVQRTYSSGVTYNEFGGLSQEQFGTQTPLYHKLHYNVRGQLYDVRLSTQSLSANEFDWNRGCVAFYYGGYAWGQSGPANNGNVTMQQHWVPYDEQAGNYQYTQDSYSYDPLNRISSASEIHGGPWGQSGPDYAQVYDYDRFGNRTIKAAQTWGAPSTQFELGPQTNQEVAEPSNRLYAPGDAGRAPSQKLMRYDAAGNLVYDVHTGQGARVYDGENRMTRAQDSTPQGWSTYAYDADGRRVRRVSSGQETWQVYGAGGELLAEYQAGAAPMVATKEYGYRGGELLVTMASGDPQRMTRFVKNLYYNCLARDASAAELQQKFDQLARAGVQGEPQLLAAAKVIARGLFESSEYAARNRTNAEYVTDLYNAYLQRAPDASGLNFWAQDAQSNGRAHTLTSFEVSSEFATLAETVYGISSAGDNQRVDHFIDEFYLGAYKGFPTPAQKLQQEQRLNAAAASGLEQVKAEARLMGAEIFQATNYNSAHTDSQYVTDLYEAFLQRTPDGPGLSFWLSKVQNEGRASALSGFQNSAEFGELAGTLYRETFWLVGDNLGTPRMVVDKSGILAGIKRHDYLPFGEEITAGIGGRSAQGQGYVFGTQYDNLRQKFTAKERDDETGLDYLGARYYSSTMGRFTSPDVPFADQWESDPQSWNLYSYVRNNPLVYTDPLGLWRQADCNTGQCWEAEKGDTLAGLAKILGVSTKSLVSFFGGSTIGIGQVFDVSGLRLDNSPVTINAYSYSRLVYVGAFGDSIDPIPQRQSGNGAAAAGVVVAADPEPISKISGAAAIALYLLLHSDPMAVVPPPKTLPAFPGAKRVPAKTPVPNFPGKKRARWEDDDYIYEWDYQHGRVEKYDKRGRHLGEFDSNTGLPTKPADPSRKIDP